eukprot:Awhi_evm1s13854
MDDDINAAKIRESGKSFRPKLANPAALGQDFADLVTQLTDYEPNVRPTLKSLLKHPFLSINITPDPAILHHLVPEYRGTLATNEDENEPFTSVIDADSLSVSAMAKSAAIPNGSF